jgi:uncharacterized protein
MVVGVINIQLEIPGCRSLKEKRGFIKPLISRLHKEFNISASEVDLQDKWRESVIACVLVSNDRIFVEQSLQQIINHIEKNWQNFIVQNHHIELISL